MTNKINIGNPDFDIECQVIGEVFCDTDAALYAFSNLVPEDFGMVQMRRIFQVALRRFQAGMPYDALSVCEDFGSQKQELKKLLYNIGMTTISTDNYQEHCRLVKTASARKRMSEIADEAMEYVVGNSTMSEMQTFLANQLEKFDSCSTRKCESAVDGMQFFLDHIDEPREYIKTGIDPIDGCLKISRGDYVILGARPSVGKTAFALQVAWRMSFDFNVAFFSFETSTQKLTERIIANQCFVPFRRIIEGNTTEMDRESIRIVKESARNHLDLVEASGMTVPEIQAEAVRLKADVIFIDYIGLIDSGEDVVVSEYEKVTKTSKDLHTMAQQRKITVFALSQLSRDGGNDAPTMASLRSSGQIEADADSILLMSRAKKKDMPEYDGGRLIQIAKNKCGELGKFYMNFDGEYQKFNKADNEDDYV